MALFSVLGQGTVTSRLPDSPDRRKIVAVLLFHFLTRGVARDHGVDATCAVVGRWSWTMGRRVRTQDGRQDGWPFFSVTRKSGAHHRPTSSARETTKCGRRNGTHEDTHLLFRAEASLRLGAPSSLLGPLPPLLGYLPAQLADLGRSRLELILLQSACMGGAGKKGGR